MQKIKYQPQMLIIHRHNESGKRIKLNAANTDKTTVSDQN